MMTGAKRRLTFRLFCDIDLAPQKIMLVSRFLGAGELSCLFGPPGSFKSGIAGDLAAHVAANKEWCNRRVTHGAVLYIACERAALVRRRFAAWRIYHEINDLPLGLVSNSIDLRSNAADASAITDCAKELEDMVRQESRLIVIDTVSRALAGGDENSPKDMGAFVNNVARIQRETAAHVMILHHIPVDGQQRMRGHGALLAACDTTIAITREGNVRIAAIDKTADGDEDEKVAFTIESLELYRDASTDEATTAPVAIPVPIPSPTAAEPKLNKNQTTMFSILHTAGPIGLTTEEWNTRARVAGLGNGRRADLHDYREQLRQKRVVREYCNRWTVVL
jgi:AAA domain